MTGIQRIPAPTRTVVVLAACIVLLAIGGAYDALITDTHVVDLQAEITNGFSFPPVFSGGLLLAGGVFAVLVAVRGGVDGIPGWVFGGFAVLFFEAGVDEMATIHEDLGTATGVDWMVLYLPIFAVGGLLWLRILRGLRGRPEATLWLGGAAAWIFSQLLEVYAYGGRPDDDGRPGAGATGAVEEILEMIGSLLLLWTVMEVYKRLRVRSAAPAPRERAAEAETAR